MLFRGVPPKGKDEEESEILIFPCGRIRMTRREMWKEQKDTNRLVNDLSGWPSKWYMVRWWCEAARMGVKNAGKNVNAVAVATG